MLDFSLFLSQEIEEDGAARRNFMLCYAMHVVQTAVGLLLT